MSKQWHPDSIVVPHGSDGVVKGEVQIVGWGRGDCFLDYRADETEIGLIEGLWAVTHAPTGWLCCVVRDQLPFAKRLVEEIEAWGDWGKHNTPRAIRAHFSNSAKETMAKHGKKVRFGIAPLWSQITLEGNSEKARAAIALAKGEAK